MNDLADSRFFACLIEIEITDLIAVFGNNADNVGESEPEGGGVVKMDCCWLMI